MQQSLRLSRVVFTGAALAVLALACDSVLDIDDPKLRPGEAGAAGGPDDTAGTSSGGSSTPQGGGDAGGDGPMITMAGASAAAGNGGEAGTGEPHECEKDEIRCGGDASKTPQICDETFHFVFNNLEADADCPVLCDAGKCTECVNDEKRCSVCDEADTTCSTNQPQTCVDGHWQDDEEACAQYCDAGICKTASSCDELDKARTTCTGNSSCCESLLIPGGSFKRDFDGSDDYEDDSFPAEVSPFYLDKFEVTIGRMRQFVTAFEQLKPKLKNGDGKSDHVVDDPGWDTSYELPADKPALISQLKCTGTTWSDNEAFNNDLPVNCAPFNLAYAFCIWDGGRLPTEAEWNFAAAGGDEQRVYPWKPTDSGAVINGEYANYANANPGPVIVGTTPMGDGRWHQSDLAGNVSEWTLDYHQDYPATCKDCLGVAVGTDRTERGGAYDNVGDFLVVSFRGYAEATQIVASRGFRCARDQ